MTRRLDARAQRCDVLVPRGYPKTIRYRFWSTIVLDANGHVDTGASTAQSLTGWTAWAFQILTPGRPPIPITPDATQQASSKISVTIPSALHASLAPHGPTYRFAGTNPTNVPIPILAGHLVIDDDPAGTGASPADTWDVDLHVGTDTIEIVQLAASSGGGGGGGGGAVDSVNGQTGVVILAAADIGFTPTGTIAANTVAGALAELATDYAAADSAEAAARANAAAAEVIARNNAISAAIAALVNSAPGALDTLNELAVALGNDPNFATTITNLVAGKQPLDSDLTAIAALATTAFGRDFLTLADAAAARTKLALGTAAQSNVGDFDAAGAAAAAQAAAVAASQPVASDLTAIAALTTTSYGRSLLTTPDVAALLASLGLGDVGAVGKLLSGITYPTHSGDRWKAGVGMTGTKLNGAIAGTGAATVTVKDPSILPTAVHRPIRIDDEVLFPTGGENTTNLTVAAVDRGINGSVAATHADKADVVRRRNRVGCWIGSSLTEGTSTSTTRAGDGWVERGGRVIAQRLGGSMGRCWPLWRNSLIAQVHQEWTLNGTALPSGNAAWDVGWAGSTIFSGGTGHGATWTRPGGERVQMLAFTFVDYGASQCGWSYRIDGGAWIDCPLSTIWSAGKGLLRTVYISCDDPTTFEVRAANAAGTSKSLILPNGNPLITYEAPYSLGKSEGILLCNMGAAGQKMRGFLNSRTFTDGVITGGTNLQTAATAIVAADVGSTIHVRGIPNTVAARVDASNLTLGTPVANGSGARFTIFQNDNNGDRMASFYGHHGSLLPDLFIIECDVNDEALPTVANGDGNPDAMYDMLTYLVSRVKPVGNVLLLAMHETTADASLQLAYRTATELVAAEQSVMCLNFYKAFAAYGLTGNAAVNAAGFMADGTHLSDDGNQWMGETLERFLGVV